ncbi:MAG: hypothetical protein IMZ46_15635, partial [Acidobacteria bacterium]|nr:hypothetical protein [Acidobacteriota bacterium]
MSAVIDPTKAGQYPVVLSDALLGGTAQNVFTNVRCTYAPSLPSPPPMLPPRLTPPDNHKPELSSETSPEQARLKPATPDSTSSYELSFQDGDAKYAYAGTRTVGDNQYVLYFDPSRKVFVLDRVDSTFNMNVTRTPDTSDPEALRRRFEQLGSEPAGNIVAKAPAQATAPPPAKTSKATPLRRKVVPKKKREEKQRGLEVPGAAREEHKKKKRNVESEEEDDDDDDDPLQVEYPGSERRGNDFSPAFPEHNLGLRPFSDFAEKLRESGNELDDEPSTSSEGGLTNFRLPSPVGKSGQNDDSEDEDDEIEMEDVPPVAREDGRSQRELEAELEAGLESGLRAQLDDGQGDLERDLEAELENGLM